MSRISDAVVLGVGPSAKGFMKRAEAEIKAQKSNGVEIKVNPNTKRATAELEAWRKVQERNHISLKVDVDKSSLRRAQQTLRRYEHTYTKSALSKAIRVNIVVAGAAALPALSKAALSTAAALTELSRAALVLPGVFSSVGAAVGTLMTGMGRVKAAFDASGESIDKAANKAKDFQKATRDLERAQRDTVKALKEANRQIEDQKDKLSNNQLSAEQARLNVLKANKALAEGADNWLDQQQLILDQKQAYQDFNETLKQSRRDIQDYYDDATKGATQTDTWKDAVDKLSDAVDGFTKAQEQAAQKTDDFTSAMSKLSPAGRDFVNQIRALSGAWSDLQQAVEQNLFDGIGSAITDLSQRRLPQLKTGMARVAQGMNADFKQILATIGSDQNADRISAIFDRTARAMNLAKPGIDAFINAFVHLSEAGSRFLPRLALALNAIGDRFDKFIDRADKDGSLDRWISKGLDSFASLGRSLGSIMDIFGSLTRAYETATGKAGGFVTTMEGGLKKLADYLGSPAGQAALIRWIGEAQDFLRTVKDALPGIVQVFHQVGEAARGFAEIWFPIISGVGRFMEEHATAVKGLLTLYLGFRTAKPIFEGIGKVWHSATAGAAAYRAKLQEIQAESQKVFDAHFKMVEVQNALAGNTVDARKRAQAANAEVAYANQAVDAAKRHLIVESDMQVLREKAEVTEKRVNEARKKYWGANAEHPERLAAENAHLANLNRIARAEEARETQARNYTTAVDRQNQALARAKTANAEYSGSVRELRTAISQTDTAQKNLSAAVSNSAGSGGAWGKLSKAIGAKTGGGLIGKLGYLVESMGGVVSAIGPTAAVTGVIYAVQAWITANDEATASVDRHKDAVVGLQGALSSVTGAATDATKKGVSDNLQDATNTATGEKYGNLLDVASAAGVDTSALVDAIARGDKGKVDQLLKPVRDRSDSAIAQLNIAGLTGDQRDILKRGLAGDPAAAEQWKQLTRTPGFSDRVNRFLELTGLSSITDLADVQHLLPGDVQKGLQLQQAAADQLRTRQDAIGQQQQSIYSTYGGATLNDRGRSVFGPNADVSAGADGTATIAIDPAWIKSNPGLLKNIQDNNGSINQSRLDGKVEATLQKDRAGLYVNRAYARGGHVWGAGTATSDSIPAMLSNGEFVVNAKAASRIGPGMLHAINAGHFSEGGWVKPIIGSAGAAQPVKPTLSSVPLINSGSVTGHPTALPMPKPVTGGPTGNLGAGATPSLYPTTPAPTALTRAALDAQHGAGIVGQPVLPAFMDYLGVRPAPGATPSSAAKPSIAVAADAAARQMGMTRPDGSRWIAGAGWVPAGDPRIYTGAKPNPSAPPVSSAHTGKGASAGPGSIASTPGVPQPYFAPFGTPPAQKSVSSSVPTYEQLGLPGAGDFQSIAKPTGAMSSRNGIRPDLFLIHTSESDLDPVSLANWMQQKGDRSYNYLVDKSGNIVVDAVDPSNAAWSVGPQGNSRSINAVIAGSHADWTRDQWIQNARGGIHSAAEIAAQQAAQWGIDPSLLTQGDPNGGIGGHSWVSQSLGGTDHTDPGAGFPWDLFMQDFQSEYAKVTANGGAIPPGNPGGAGSPNILAGLPGAGSGSGLPGLGNGIPGFNAPLPGPFGDIPFNGQDLLGSIGKIILGAIGSFFGIDLTGIFDFFSRIADGVKGMQIPGLGQNANLPPIPNPNIDPGPDQNIISQLVDQARQAKADGNEPLARQFLDAANQYGSRQASPGSAPVPITAGGSAPAASYSGGNQGVYDAVYAQFKAAGYSDDQWGSLVEIINHESGWNPTISNPSSGAFGLFQFLGHENDVYGQLGGYSGDAAKEAVAGLQYIKDRYGSPAAAWQFWQAHNWYKDGGPVNPILPGQPVQPPTDFQRTLSYYGLIKTGIRQGPGNFNPGVSLDTSRVSYSVGDTSDGWRDRFRMRNGLGNLLGANGYDGGLTPSWPYDVGPWAIDWNSPADVIKHSIGHAGGGPVSGPGTATSDSIPAMLSDGEFVMRAAAVNKYGKGFMHALNGGVVHAAGGGWFGPAAGSAGQSKGQLPLQKWGWLGNQPEQKQASIGGGALAGAQSDQALKAPSRPIEDGGGGFNFRAQDSGKKERGILAAAPATRDHNLKALSTGIQAGAANVGSWINTAVGLAAGAAGGAGVPGAGTAASLAAPFIQGGTQLAGNFIDGLLNVISSGAVGTVTTSQTGQGYGAPLNAQPATVANRTYQSNHYGDVTTNNLDQYTATQKRMEAQRSLPFLNRI